MSPEVQNDPELDNNSPGSRRPSRFSSNSTGGASSSYSRGGKSDELDPYRRAEQNGGFWKPHHSNSTKGPDEGTRDSTKAEEGGGQSRTNAGSGGSGTSTDDPNIRDQERNPPSDEEGLYHDEGSSGTGTGKYKAKFLITRRQAAVGAGAAVGIGGIGIALFLTLIPLKVEDIVTDLENRFFATANNAVSNQIDDFTQGYLDIVAKAMKGGNCSHQGKIVISKNCTLNFANGGDPITNLYKTWSQYKFENILADDYGIELRYDTTHGGTYYLKAPGISGEEKVSNGDGTFDEGFAKVDRSTVRTAFKNAESDMTNYEKVMFRYKRDRLLSEKYGIHWCLTFCGTRDAFANNTSNAKYAAKAYLISNVVEPRSAALGAVLDCILNSNCDNTSSTTCAETDESCAELGGEPETQIESATETDVGEATSSLADKSASKLISGIAAAKDAGGLENLAIKTVLTQLGFDSIADGATAGINIAGTLGEISNALKSIGPDSKKASYLVNSVGAVSLFAMLSTAASELHTGQDSAAEVGSYNTLLSSGDQCIKALEGSKCNQVGGTAGAEDTPLYGNLIDGSGTLSTGSSKGNYLCQNKKPVPSGQLVCPEEELGAGNATAENVSTFFSKGFVGTLTSVIGSVGGAINDVTSVFSGILGGIIGKIPGVSDVTGLITNAIKPFVTGLVSDIVPDPLNGGDASGGRIFDETAIGADASGSTFTEDELGGAPATATQTAKVASAQAVQAQQQFSQQPLMARLFSSSPYSLVSHIALAMPFGTQNVENDFSSLVTDPFSSLESSFSSLFTSKVDAGNLTGVVNGKDFAGVPQFMPVVESDPITYWDKYCNSNPADGYQDSDAYDTQTQTDSNNDLPEPTAADPCMTINTSASVACGDISTTCLSSDDLAAATSSGSSSSGSGASPDCQTATGNTKILCEAEQYKGIYYEYGGGHQGYKPFISGCPDPSNPPDNEPSGGPVNGDPAGLSGNPSPCATDCSGLIYIALDEAFNLDLMGTVSGSGVMSVGDWKSIPISQAQPGDIVTLPGHVEIVDQVNGSSITTFGSHETGTQTGTVTSSTSYWTDGAWQWVGSGST